MVSDDKYIQPLIQRSENSYAAKCTFIYLKAETKVKAEETGD